MKEVQVNVPGHSYTIKLGSGVIKDLPAELKRLNPSSCLIVTNITVGSLYLKKVSESVKSEAIWHVYWHDKKAEDMLKNAFDEVGIALEYRDFKSDTKFWD